MHGVIVKKSGEIVEVNIGEQEGDPVFCVTDLLPHLAAEQNMRPLKDGLKGEEPVSYTHLLIYNLLLQGYYFQSIACHSNPYPVVSVLA